MAVGAAGRHAEPAVQQPSQLELVEVGFVCSCSCLRGGGGGVLAGTAADASLAAAGWRAPLPLPLLLAPTLAPSAWLGSVSTI